MMSDIGWLFVGAAFGLGWATRSWWQVVRVRRYLRSDAGRRFLHRLNRSDDA